MGRIPAALSVTHVCMIAPMQSTMASATTSARMGRSPTMRETRIRSFGCPLESRSFSARHHSSSELLRTLQMVAASEPTSWMSVRRHILTIH